MLLSSQKNRGHLPPHLNLTLNIEKGNLKERSKTYSFTLDKPAINDPFTRTKKSYLNRPLSVFIAVALLS